MSLEKYQSCTWPTPSRAVMPHPNVIPRQNCTGFPRIYQEPPVIRALICCLVLLLSPMLLEAQIANNTSLVGTVVDSSGGVISNSKVIAVEENTKVVSSAVTNAEGYYAITFI